MSCGQVALKRAGIPVASYFASEIDKPAIQVAKNNFPDIIHIGDVTKIEVKNLPRIDLVLAGSPCQGFSFAGGQLAFDDPRSKLFFNFIDALDYLEQENPDILFMLENTKMRTEFLDIITEYTGVDPVLLNSSLVSAQSRARYYWVNWKIKTPVDRGILLRDVLEDAPTPPAGLAIRDKSKCLRVGGRGSAFGDRHEWDIPFKRVSGGVGTHAVTRRYSVTECERLQTLPDGYTAGVSDTQRFKMLGNGWTVDMIIELLRSSPLCPTA